MAKKPTTSPVPSSAAAAAAASSKRKRKAEAQPLGVPPFKKRSRGLILLKDHPMALKHHEAYQQTFSEWLIELFNKIQPILPPFSFRQSKFTYRPVHEHVRMSIRLLIGSLYTVLGMGFYLSKGTLSKSNLVVCEGNLKFKQLFVEDLDVADPVNVASANNNFTELRAFILDTFFEGRHQEIPVDMMELLNLLDADNARNKRSLIEHNFALMNDRGRRDFISKWHDIIDQFDSIQWTTYEYICRQLPLWDTYYNKFESGSPLEMCYNGGWYFGDYNDQVKFFRHSLAHLLQYCRMGDQTQPPEFFYDDCLNIILAVYCDAISMFPQLLHKAGLLDCMKPEKYFYPRD